MPCKTFSEGAEGGKLSISSLRKGSCTILLGSPAIQLQCLGDRGWMDHHHIGHWRCSDINFPLFFATNNWCVHSPYNYPCPAPHCCLLMIPCPAPGSSPPHGSYPPHGSSPPHDLSSLSSPWLISSPWLVSSLLPMAHLWPMTRLLPMTHLWPMTCLQSLTQVMQLCTLNLCGLYFLSSAFFFHLGVIREKCSCIQTCTLQQTIHACSYTCDRPRHEQTYSYVLHIMLTGVHIHIYYRGKGSCPGLFVSTGWNRLECLPSSLCFICYDVGL